MTKFRIAAVAIVAGAAVFTASCSSDSSEAVDTSTTTTAAAGETTTTGATPTQSINELASTTADLTTLSGLVKKAGLEKALDGPGTFTLLAPTNAALAKIQPAVDSMSTDPQGALRQMLRLNLLTTQLDKAKLADSAGQCLDTLNGGKLKVEKQGDGVTVGGAAVADEIQAANGTILVLDSAVTRPSTDC